MCRTLEPFREEKRLGHTWEGEWSIGLSSLLLLPALYFVGRLVVVCGSTRGRTHTNTVFVKMMHISPIRLLSQHSAGERAQSPKPALPSLPLLTATLRYPKTSGVCLSYKKGSNVLCFAIGAGWRSGAAWTIYPVCSTCLRFRDARVI